MAQIFFHNDSIVEVLESGVHAGSRVVNGTSWYDALQDNFLQCLDVSESKAEVIELVKNDASLSSLGTITEYFTVEASSLPTSAQENLGLSNRASVTASEMLSAIEWAEGMDANYIYSRESEE
tara:strand:- start:4504 stop:4872 length:369 start_codon:yes stop_codon:yes gene_type:complete